MLQGVDFDLPGLLAPGLPDLRTYFGDGLPAGNVEAGADPLEGGLQLGVMDRPGGGLIKVFGLDFRP